MPNLLTLTDVQNISSYVELPAYGGIDGLMGKDEWKSPFNTPRTDASGKRYNPFPIKYVKTVDKLDFTYTLSLIDNVKDFLSFAKCYYSAGFFKMEDHFYTLFSEIVVYEYTKEAFDLLELVNIADLRIAIQYYQNLLKKIQGDSAYINTPAYVKISIDTSYKRPDTVLNDIARYNKYYNFKVEFSPEEKTNLTTILTQASTVLTNRIIDLEARIAQLRDASANIVQTDWLKDPSKNPLLVYSQNDSQGDTIVYKDTASNNVASYQPITAKISVTPKQYFLQAPQIRQEYSRTFITPSGLMNQGEYDRYYGTTPEKKDSIIPLLAIAGIGIAVASQVL